MSEEDDTGSPPPDGAEDVTAVLDQLARLERRLDDALSRLGEMEPPSGALGGVRKQLDELADGITTLGTKVDQAATNADLEAERTKVLAHDRTLTALETADAEHTKQLGKLQTDLNGIDVAHRKTSAAATTATKTLEQVQGLLGVIRVSVERAAQEMGTLEAASEATSESRAATPAAEPVAADTPASRRSQAAPSDPAPPGDDAGERGVAPTGAGGETKTTTSRMPAESVLRFVEVVAVVVGVVFTAGIAYDAHQLSARANDVASASARVSTRAEAHEILFGRESSCAPSDRVYPLDGVGEPRAAVCPPSRSLRERHIAMLTLIELNAVLRPETWDELATERERQMHVAPSSRQRLPSEAEHTFSHAHVPWVAFGSTEELRGAYFDRADLRCARFHRSPWGAAQCEAVDVRHAAFTQADLAGAWFCPQGFDWTEEQFDSRFEGVDWAAARCPDGTFVQDELGRPSDAPTSCFGHMTPGDSMAYCG